MMENRSFKPNLLRNSILELEKKILAFQKMDNFLKQEKTQKKGLFFALLRWIVK